MLKLYWAFIILSIIKALWYYYNTQYNNYLEYISRIHMILKYIKLIINILIFNII